MTYKLMTDAIVQRLSDGACIPFVEGNRDYQAYLDWVAAGNTPDPADPPPPPDTRRAQALKALQDVIDDAGTAVKFKLFFQALKLLL